jgi:sialate O-acetylesterase
MRRKLLLSYFLLLTPAIWTAETSAFEPADVFRDHMVLQRGKPVPVWGTAEPGETVTVNFAGQNKSATANPDGKWQVVLDPLTASTRPQTLTIAGKNTVTVKDVLVGDVWIFSGQSNMGRNVGRHPTPSGMKWNHPLIRYWGAGKDQPYPIKQFESAPDAWTVCQDEETTKGCCAVGFYFARHIQQQGIGVPQGILWQAWAGSIIQEWIPRHGFRLDPELKELADRVDVYYPHTPHGREVWKQRLPEIERWLAEAKTAMAQNKPFPYPQPLMPEPGPRDLCGFYNGKIHPIVPMAIKGVVWYQGESDFRNRFWDIEMKVMAKTWRDLFTVDGDGGEIPFYWMQLQRSGDYCSPLVRQEQLNALKLVPNSGMAVLLDFDVNVHPANKVDAGIRAARWALHRDYGRSDIVPSGPLYKSHRVDGNQVIVDFDDASGGLRLGEKDMLNPPKLTDKKEVPNVEVAGEDRRWQKAVAKIEGDKLVAWSDKVDKPVHVRYCYTNIPPPPFLYNGAGLPAAMFTTLPD